MSSYRKDKGETTVSALLDVIERKQAERALVENEDKYHALFEKLPIGIILIDCETSHIIDCNVEFERLAGRRADDIRGISLWDIIHSSELNFLKLVQESALYSAEAELHKPNGEVIITRLDSCIVNIGTHQCIQTAIYDITERKKIYDALQASEEFNSSLLDSSPNATIVHNPDSSIVYVNHAFEELTGYFSAEVVGKLAPHPWWTDETKCKSKSQLLKILRRGKMKDEEVFQRKNGEKFIVEINSAPVIINDKFQHLLSTWLDITERRQSEKALGESEQFNASLLNNSPNPVLVINPDTSIRYINPALEELTGFSSAELIGRKVPYPWIPEDSVVEATRRINKNLLGGESRVEKRIINKKGEHIWIRINSAAVKENGKIKYVLSNWSDITERKKAEKRLVKLNKELRNLSAHLESIRENERTRIAREIHDELGQSLAALKMDVCWLSDNLVRGQDNLRELTESMAKLIDVTVQKTKRLCIELRPKLLDDIGIVGTIEWLVKEFQKATGIKCTLAFDLDEKTLDNERATAIFRIFQEALTNIYRHSKATKALISLTQSDNKVVLQVTDNGIGIKQERIDSPQSLGIIGMRERLHFFGGDIEIKGTNTRGTKLIVRIPLLRRRTR
jgi:PAS domain S-box-containing protein